MHAVRTDCTKDLRHLPCPTCLQDCTQSTVTMYSKILPGNPCFVFLPPKPCCKRVPISLVFDSAADVAQQQNDKRIINASWKKPLCHKQRLGVLDDVWVEALAFYRSRTGNMRSAFSKTLDARSTTICWRQVGHSRCLRSLMKDSFPKRLKVPSSKTSLKPVSC